MRKRKQFLISDKEIARRYVEGESLNDIAKDAQTNKGLMSLRKRLIDLGVDTSKNMKRYSQKLSNSRRKYKLNESIFEYIDTEHKAYWLGFLMADGYNQVKKRAVELSLSLADINHLEKFKEFMGTDKPIGIYKSSTLSDRKRSILIINSIKVSKDLEKLGMVQNKTFCLKFPSLKDELFKHFLRGYFDADGCISITDRHNRPSNSYQFYFMALRSNIEIIKAYLQSKFPEMHFGIHDNKQTKGIDYLRVSGRKNIEIICNFLYKDSTIYLDRKYKKAMQVGIPQQ